MENLLFFGLWAVILFMTMRAVWGAHVMGHRTHGPVSSSSDGANPDDLRWVPPEEDKDPVCGKTVKTADAKPSVYDGRVIYFCSRMPRNLRGRAASPRRRTRQGSTQTIGGKP